MHFSLPTILALAISATAVDVVIYPNSANCDDNSGGLQCGGVDPLVCCNNGGGDIFSVKCTGLDTQGVPDQCVIADGPGPDAAFCQTALNSLGGEPTECVDPGTAPAGRGGYWIAFPDSRLARRSAQCTGAVKPDAALFNNGRKFKINYDVPTNVTDMLVSMVKSDGNLSKGVPEELLDYEIV